MHTNPLVSLWKCYLPLSFCSLCMWLRSSSLRAPLINSSRMMSEITRKHRSANVLRLKWLIEQTDKQRLKNKIVWCEQTLILFAVFLISSSLWRQLLLSDIWAPAGLINTTQTPAKDPFLGGFIFALEVAEHWIPSLWTPPRAYFL